MHKCEICEVCKGSGETSSYGVLDCAAPGCTAATERHELEQLAGDASLTDYDARWLAYQLGKARALEQAENFARCYDLGTPDGHAIAAAIRALK